MDFEVVFIEKEDPSRDSSGGVMTYLIGLNNYLNAKNIKTTLVSVGEKQSHSIFQSYYTVCKNSQIGNFKYLLYLFLHIPLFRFRKNLILHAQRPDMLVPFLIFKKRKTIITLHGRQDKQVKLKKSKWALRFYLLLQYYAFQKTNKLIAVSKETAVYYRRLYPFISNKITIIPNGVDLNIFKPFNKTQCRNQLGYSPNSKIILYAGRLEKEKNLSFLLDAFKIVSLHVPECILIIAGSGTEAYGLQEKAKKEKIKNIDFKGEIKHNLLPYYINCADAFAFCSLFEGSPIIIREVLACHVPVVSVDVGDISQLLSHFEGCAISEREPEVFAKQLCKILNHPQTYDYSQLTQTFSSDKTYSETLNIYNSVFYEKNSCPTV